MKTYIVTFDYVEDFEMTGRTLESVVNKVVKLAKEMVKNGAKYSHYLVGTEDAYLVDIRAQKVGRKIEVSVEYREEETEEVAPVAEEVAEESAPVEEASAPAQKAIATDLMLEEGLTNRQKANKVLKALTLLTGCDNGTIRNPSEAASVVMADGRTLIQTVNEDGYLMYNDGGLIVEVDDYMLYVDYTSKLVRECGMEVEYVGGAIECYEDEEGSEDEAPTANETVNEQLTL